MENVVKELKKASGFSAYVIMNNDGIVIKYENMSYQTAVHHAALVLDLTEKSKKYAREVFQPSEVRRRVGSPHFKQFVTVHGVKTSSCCLSDTQNNVESLRLRTKEHELIVSQKNHFTVAVIQEDSRLHMKDSRILSSEDTESTTVLG